MYNTGNLITMALTTISGNFEPLWNVEITEWLKNSQPLPFLALSGFYLWSQVSWHPSQFCNLSTRKKILNTNTQKVKTYFLLYFKIISLQNGHSNQLIITKPFICIICLGLHLFYMVNYLFIWITLYNICREYNTHLDTSFVHN